MSPDTLGNAPVFRQTPLASGARHGFVIGLAGWSGSGKTTLAEQLISALATRGKNVATIKHAHHQFDADIPGKDSHRHRMAGARQVLVSSALRSALFTENGDTGDRSLDDLLGALAPADIVLVEGFKREPLPKIEVFRAAVGKPPLWPDDRWIVALATDQSANTPANTPANTRDDQAPLIQLDLNDPETIADFICECAGAGAGASASSIDGSIDGTINGTINGTQT
jgi:molybdopterin-guanine dinucleotide biosynthesis protein B